MQLFSLLQEIVALLSNEMGSKLRELRRGNLTKALQSCDQIDDYQFQVK